MQYHEILPVLDRRVEAGTQYSPLQLSIARPSLLHLVASFCALVSMIFPAPAPPAVLLGSPLPFRSSSYTVALELAPARLLPALHTSSSSLSLADRLEPDANGHRLPAAGLGRELHIGAITALRAERMPALNACPIGAPPALFSLALAPSPVSRPCAPSAFLRSASGLRITFALRLLHVAARAEEEKRPRCSSAHYLPLSCSQLTNNAAAVAVDVPKLYEIGAYLKVRASPHLHSLSLAFCPTSSAPRAFVFLARPLPPACSPHSAPFALLPLSAIHVQSIAPAPLPAHGWGVASGGCSPLLLLLTPADAFGRSKTIHRSLPSPSRSFESWMAPPHLEFRRAS
jgi:hypothetical protein